MKTPTEYRYLPKDKDLLPRRVFCVYPNKTYQAEKNGNFLWSPKYAIDGRCHPGYETMKEVRAGDIILHSYKTNIVAISKAKAACVSFNRPSVEFSEWDADGWKIESEYFELPFELPTDAIFRKLYAVQPNNGPLDSTGAGKQQYLCNANKRMLDCILNAYVAAATKTDQVDDLLNFLQLEKTAVSSSESAKDDKELFEEAHIEKVDEKFVVEGCKVAATILSTMKNTTLTIDTEKYPKQKTLIGKTVGDVFEIAGINLKYQITKIWTETEK